MSAIRLPNLGVFGGHPYSTSAIDLLFSLPWISLVILKKSWRNISVAALEEQYHYLPFTSLILTKNQLEVGTHGNTDIITNTIYLILPSVVVEYAGYYVMSTY